MYSDKPSGYHTALHAECLFGSFKQSVTRSTIYCQTYSTIPDDYTFFSTQFWNNITPEQQAEFCQHMWPVQNLYYVIMRHIRQKKKAKSDDAEVLEKETKNLISFLGD